MKKKIQLFLPSDIDIPLGTNFHNNSYITIQDSFISDTSYHHFAQSCTSDFQDKTVKPSRENNIGFVDEEITYTIRFNNLRSTISCDILLIDTLSSALDISTFEFISSSHEDIIEMELLEDSILHFHFPNINLEPYNLSLIHI